MRLLSWTDNVTAHRHCLSIEYEAQGQMDLWKVNGPGGSQDTQRTEGWSDEQEGWRETGFFWACPPAQSGFWSLGVNATLHTRSRLQWLARYLTLTHPVSVRLPSDTFSIAAKCPRLASGQRVRGSRARYVTTTLLETARCPRVDSGTYLTQ